MKFSISNGKLSEELHEELRSQLMKWAESNRFMPDAELQFGNPPPDLLLSGSIQGKSILFIGNILDNNEEACQKEMRRRIQDYAATLEKIVPSNYAGAYLAMASDNYSLAKNWEAELGKICSSSEFTSRICIFSSSKLCWITCCLLVPKAGTRS